MFGKFSKKAKMAAAEAERNEAMKKALRDFSNFVKSFLNGKSDEQVDWLALAKEAFAKWYYLVEEFPEAAELLNWKPEVRPEDRVYTWFDDEGLPRSYSYAAMLRNKEEVERINLWEQYRADAGNNNLTLEDIGFTGGGLEFPYEAVAYLSFAYLQKMDYTELLKSIDELLS